MDLSYEYYPWIELAQSSRYKELSEISEIANKNIKKFTENANSISFDTVFKSLNLKLNIKLLIFCQNLIKRIFIIHIELKLWTE